MTEPETLPYDKCLDLLRKSIVGRVGFAVGDGLKIIPVNYVVIGDAVVLRTRPDSELGYEYLPEEEVSTGRFAAIVAAIDDAEVQEAVDWAHLQCASGVCPI